MTVRYRRAKVTLYGKSNNYPRYRLAFYAAGKRHTKSFDCYASALAAAKAKAKAIASAKSVAATIEEAEARSFRAAVAKLDDLARELTAANPDSSARPVRLNLDDVIAEYVEAKRKHGSGRLVEAANTHAATRQSIIRKTVTEAVAEFLAERKRATAPDREGARPKLSHRMYVQDRLRLEKFGNAHVMDLCDVGSAHLDNYFSTHLKDLAPKSKNHHRSCLGLFSKWAVRRKYLPANHTWADSDHFRPGGKRVEQTDVPEVTLYTAEELGKLLAEATGPLQVLLALQAFAGVRVAEAFRLSWEDVWRRPGYIEVRAGQSKTRSRRLIPIQPSLAAWLLPWSEHKTGRIWPAEEFLYHKSVRELHAAVAVNRQPNALRHGFVTARLRILGDEHRVASEAGTSPAMIHQHYRELSTAEEATAWFAVLPPDAAPNVIAAPLREEVVA